jgi:hypothetical protein
LKAPIKSLSEGGWFRRGARACSGALPTNNRLHEFTVNRDGGGGFKMDKDVLEGKVAWQVLAMAN